MNHKIIAVDFDGTLCENKWPEIGAPNEELFLYLKRQKAAVARIILWTCRIGDRLDEAVRWCQERGLDFDAVNENVPEVVDRFGSDTRKVFANEYIDDRMRTEFNLPFISGSSISWSPRPIGYDLSGFVKTKQDGERLLEMVKDVLGITKPESWLDWRAYEPEWIQFKFQKSEFHLEKLQKMANDNSRILTKDILLSCKV